jgi:hypothetical protein
MLVNMKSATRMFVAGAAATAVLAAPMAAVIWTEAATGGTKVTTSADPGHPGCTDVNGAPCAPGTAGVSVPGANATAGQGNASVSVPDANAAAGPGNATASVPGANATAGQGNASVSVPDANAAAGPNNATASVPGANANAGPGYFNGCINGWCWNAG